MDARHAVQIGDAVVFFDMKDKSNPIRKYGLVIFIYSEDAFLYRDPSTPQLLYPAINLITVHPVLEDMFLRGNKPQVEETILYADHPLVTRGTMKRYYEPLLREI